MIFHSCKTFYGTNDTGVFLCPLKLPVSLKLKTFAYYIDKQNQKKKKLELAFHDWMRRTTEAYSVCICISEHART